MSSDSEVATMLRVFLDFSYFVSLNFSRISQTERVITLSHSTGFRYNLVHKQTTFPSTGWYQNISLLIFIFAQFWHF